MSPRCLLLIAALGFAACEAPPPPPEPVPAPDSTAASATVPDTSEVLLEGVEDLVGDWLVTERPGASPDDEPSTVTFMPNGDYLVLNADGIVEQATYRLVDESLIAVTDSNGTRDFEFVRDGRTLTLTTPGTESTTVLERRDGNY